MVRRRCYSEAPVHRKRCSKRQSRFLAIPEEQCAIAQYILSRTVGLISGDNPADVANAGKLDGASAVKLKVGGRYFLATAGHFLKDGQVPQIVRRRGEEPIATFANIWWNCRGADVGVLELFPADSRNLGDFLGKDCLLPRFRRRGKVGVLVSGFPCAYYLKEGPSTFWSVGKTFIGQLLPTSTWSRQWPDSDIGPPNKKKDMLVQYPKETGGQILDRHLNRHSAEGMVQANVHPKGLSGAGIWAPLFVLTRRSQVRFPHAQLIGIQVAFHDRLGILRAGKIGLWLDLIGQKCPELRVSIRRIKARSPIAVVRQGQPG